MISIKNIERGARRPPVSRRSFTVLVLAALLVLAGAWAFAGCGSGQADSSGLASAQAKATVETMITANNQGDAAGLQAVYAQDANFYDLLYTPPGVTQGRDAIAKMIVSFKDMIQWEARGEPIQVGDYVVQAVLGIGEAKGTGVLVFELSDGGQIVNSWFSGQGTE